MKLLSRIFLPFLTIIIFLACSVLVYGETKTSIASGTWNTSSVWNPAGVPAANDDVIIGNGTTITLNVNTEIINSLTIQTGAILQGDGTGWVLLIGDAEGTDFVNNGTLDASGTNSLVVSLSSNSEWSGTGTYNCSTIDLNSNTLSFASGANIVLNLSGLPNPFLNPGSVVPGTSVTFNYNGSSEQIISGSAIATFTSLIISNSAGVTLGANTTINGVLNLNTGIVTTNSYTLIISSTGTVVRSSGYVNGNLQKYIDAGPITIDYEIGDLTAYSPVSLHFDSVITPGNLTAISNSADHPFLPTSGLDGAKSVNRYWSFSNLGTIFSYYDATFNFISSDIDAGANSDSFIVDKYSGSSWNRPQIGLRTSTSTQILNVGEFSDFAVGETKKYSISANATAHGSINPSGTVTVSHGMDQSFTITPDIQCYIDSLTVDGLHVDSTTSYTFKNVTNDHSISAYFSAAQHTLTVTATNGSVGKNPDQSTYDYGATVELMATPATGYHFIDWGGDAGGSANPITVTMDGDKNITANFAINTYTLTVSATNGSVTKAPDQTTYDHGTSVQLTATPATGYHFIDWSGDAGGSANPITVTMDGNKNITANFIINTYILSASASAHGTISPSGITTVTHGIDQIFTITPDIGCYLDSLVVDGLHVDSTTSYTFENITSDHAISAYFSINTYTLTVSATNGSITKNPDQTTYDYGTTVQLTAVPNPGYHFVDWTGDTTGSANPITLTMDVNKNISANFAINTYTLTVNAANGAVTKNPDQTIYNHGTTVQLTATPIPGHHFVDWTGDATGSTNPLTITMDGNKNIIANFAINTYTLTIITANGTVAKNPDQTTYNHGITVQLTATPNTGYHFVNWSGGASGSTNSVIITMDSNKSVTANFAINTYTLTMNASNGSITKNPDQTTYNHGTTVQLTAIPNAGYNFVNWTGDMTGSANPLTVTMDSNKNITANFAINTYTLTTSATNGVISRNPNQASYNYGTTVLLTATPNTGYHFVSWSGDASGSANPLAITMDGNKNITATFAINTYTLTVNSANGNVARVPNQASYNHGSVVQLTATPNTGYRFSSWSGNASGTANPITIIMDGNKIVTANFVANTFTLTVNATNGSVTKNPNRINYDYGTAVQLTAIPNTGYHFVNWGGSASGSANPLTITMDGNKLINATFAINTYTLTITTANGTVTKSPNQTTYNHGTSVRLTATPYTGYRFVSWSGDISSTANPVNITMNSDRNVIANYEINTYTVSVSVQGSGSITINPDQLIYEHGSIVELTAIPADTGWSFSRWSGDLVSTSNPVTFAVDNVKNITATFAPSSAYAVMYRTITAESLALSRDNYGKLNKFIKRKPDKTEFRFSLIADSVRDITLEFSKDVRSLDIVKALDSGDTLYKNVFFGTTKKIFVKLEPTSLLMMGDTIVFHGFCAADDPIKVKYCWTGSEKQYVPYFILNKPRLPMPNRVNLLYESFIQGGFYGTGGLTVGLPRFDSTKYYGWLQTQRYSDILRTLIVSKTLQRHTGKPRGFDITWNGKVLLNQMRVIPPSKHDNMLLSEIVALKLNIVASAMGKLPRGFGELIYGDETDNPLNGMTVKDISRHADVLITGVYRGDWSRKSFVTAAEFENLAQSIHKINESFEGRLDTVAFLNSLVFNGLKQLRSVSYLHANPYEAITVITPLTLAVSENPEAYTLYQNYPNPFNPATTIEFELQDNALVTLKVYNILGQEIATLFDREPMDAGIQDVEFNGANLASGVYLYRLIAEMQTEGYPAGATLSLVRKMILLK